MNVGTPRVLAHSWLLLIHQLPAKPAYLRVKFWRRLQGIGRIANAVHALPMNEQTQEDFEWLLREIQEGGGEAFVLRSPVFRTRRYGPSSTKLVTSITQKWSKTR